MKASEREKEEKKKVETNNLSGYLPESVVAV